MANDMNSSDTLEATLREIAQLEPEKAPYGVSFSLRGDDPLSALPASEVAEYVLEVIKKSDDLVRRSEEILPA